MFIATTKIPKAIVGRCTYLNVVETNRFGAFLDLGLPKDILVPFSEQETPMQEGRAYVVYLYIDSMSERITGTTRLDNYLSKPSICFEEKQRVNLLIYGRTYLGYKAVVNGTALGLIFISDVFKTIKYGQALIGYIKRIRDDNKLDLCLQLSDREALDVLSIRVLSFIKLEGGRTTLTDESKPEDISAQFGVSKSSYKKALGKLYKQRLVLITKDVVSLVE